MSTSRLSAIRELGERTVDIGCQVQGLGHLPSHCLSLSSALLDVSSNSLTWFYLFHGIIFSHLICLKGKLGRRQSRWYPSTSMTNLGGGRHVVTAQRSSVFKGIHWCILFVKRAPHPTDCILRINPDFHFCFLRAGVGRRHR